MSEAKRAAAPVERLALWYLAVHGSLPRRKQLLHPSTVRKWLNEDPRAQTKSKNTYQWAVRRLSTSLYPEFDQEWRTGQKVTSYEERVPPYHDPEILGMFRHAWAQPTAALRDALLALLYLSLGAGLPPAQLAGVRGTDVVRRRDDAVVVYLRARSHHRKIRRRYQPGLLALAATIGSELMLGGYVRGRNVTGDLAAALAPAGGLPKIEAYRLVSTYDTWLADRFSLAAIRDQRGSSELRGFASLLDAVPPVSEEVAVALLCGGDDDDGPWAPDYPLRGAR